MKAVTLKMLGKRKLSNVSEWNEDEVLNQVMDRNERAQCLRKIKNNKTGGSDGFVGELLKYGGERMVLFIREVFKVLFCMARQW